jgi:hypothetical protein
MREAQQRHGCALHRVAVESNSAAWSLASWVADESHQSARATSAQGVAPGYGLAAPLGLVSLGTRPLGL